MYTVVIPMRSYFPDTDIGKRRKYTGYFSHVGGCIGRRQNLPPPFIFVKSMEGIIVSNKDIIFPLLDKYFGDRTVWRTAVQWDVKENRKYLKQISSDMTRLTAKD